MLAVWRKCQVYCCCLPELSNRDEDLTQQGCFYISTQITNIYTHRHTLSMAAMLKNIFKIIYFKNIYLFMKLTWSHSTLQWHAVELLQVIQPYKIQTSWTFQSSDSDHRQDSKFRFMGYFHIPFLGRIVMRIGHQIYCGADITWNREGCKSCS